MKIYADENNTNYDNIIHSVCKAAKSTVIEKVYHIARKFGRKLNLAVWQYALQIAKLKSVNIKLFWENVMSHSKRVYKIH